MANNTPIQTVKKNFESKEKLISSIAGSVKNEGESESEAAARLKSVSNKKLLRMSEVAKQIADRGGRDEVISALGTALGRTKDEDYLTKLGTFSSATLMDMLRVAEKSAKA
ncbi:MAG: hypothetical protein JKY56_10495 [Kofleriaceae bacterium]|nr:hypothetical protein [Kofleriaceae bacterium]